MGDRRANNKAIRNHGVAGREGQREDRKDAEPDGHLSSAQHQDPLRGPRSRCPDPVSWILFLYRIPVHGLERLRDPPRASPLDGRWLSSDVPYAKGVGRPKIASYVEEHLFTLCACSNPSARWQSIHCRHVRPDGDDRLVWGASVGQDGRD